MVHRILILGGRGRIGRSVAADIATYTQAEITLTGRTETSASGQRIQLSPKMEYLILDVADQKGLETAIATHDVVIHCAGPFRYRDTGVLRTCIEKRVDYLDVSDDRSFTHNALALKEAAAAAGVTAIINTGVFPGISNSMVRQGVEQLDSVDLIHLSYVVAGSGGAGVTVMRTTFLGLQNPFDVWVNGRWETVRPYTDRETIEFPAPFGRTGVYWFDMPETTTLPDSFPAQTVIVKFGSAPDFYNHLTSIVARWFPKPLVQHPQTIEFLSNVSHKMTSV